MSPEEYVGYENLIRFIEDRALQHLDGDIIEIGAYMGGGTVKLAGFARKYGKRVFAVDTFDPSVDRTVGRGGVTAGEVYEAFLEGPSMFEIYQKTTQGLENIVTIRKDSRYLAFPRDQRFFFGLVDGCHQRSYVENDFAVVWPQLVSGGAIGFHDYRFDDWPEVTPAVDGIVADHRIEIAETVEIRGKGDVSTLLLVKR
jgi:Methyltransferase domain